MVRRKVIFILLFFLYLSSQAQTQKGSFLVGGNLGYSHEKVHDNYQSDINSNFNIAPQAGYFLVKNFVLGLTLNLSHDNSKYQFPGAADGTEISSNKNTSLLLGPFARYYFMFSPKTSLYVHTGFVLGPGTSKFNDSYSFSSSKGKTFGNGFVFGPGFTYFLNKNVGLEASVQYGINSSKNTIPITDQAGNLLPNSTTKTKTNSLLVSIGFQIYLSKQ